MRSEPEMGRWGISWAREGMTEKQNTAAGLLRDLSSAINLDALPDMSRPLPATEQVIHFGGGQTEAMVTLAPGEHTLQLLLGDFAHIPMGEDMLSPKISITVVE